MPMFEGFEQQQIETSGATINLVTKGDGPPLLLLHGYRQTHVMWHHIAPRLAGEFALVAADLPGSGASSKPPGGGAPRRYCKGPMSPDLVGVVGGLGSGRPGVGPVTQGS